MQSRFVLTCQYEFSDIALRMDMGSARPFRQTPRHAPRPARQSRFPAPARRPPGTEID